MLNDNTVKESGLWKWNICVVATKLWIYRTKLEFTQHWINSHRDYWLNKVHCGLLKSIKAQYVKMYKVESTSVSFNYSEFTANYWAKQKYLYKSTTVLHIYHLVDLIQLRSRWQYLVECAVLLICWWYLEVINFLFDSMCRLTWTV